MFVDRGVKVLPRCLAVSADDSCHQTGIAGDTFVFQQDSAPAHCTRNTIQLLQRETPDFIGPDLWPPNSPDLNPIDYKI